MRYRRQSTVQTSNRRGSFLVETLIAASVSSVIILVAIGWIHQSFKLAKTVKQKQQHHQQLMRLDDQFRQDVRLCQRIEQDANGRLLLRSELRGDVVYEVSESVVFRTHTPGLAEQTHGDRYPLASGSEIHWDDTELPEWITLVVLRSRDIAKRPVHLQTDRPEAAQSVDSDVRPVDLRIRVGVGRWLIPSSEEPNL